MKSFTLVFLTLLGLICLSQAKVVSFSYLITIISEKFWKILSKNYILGTLYLKFCLKNSSVTQMLFQLSFEVHINSTSQGNTCTCLDMTFPENFSEFFDGTFRNFIQQPFTNTIHYPCRFQQVKAVQLFSFKNAMVRLLLLLKNVR